MIFKTYDANAASHEASFWRCLLALAQNEQWEILAEEISDHADKAKDKEEAEQAKLRGQAWRLIGLIKDDPKMLAELKSALGPS